MVDHPRASRVVERGSSPGDIGRSAGDGAVCQPGRSDNVRCQGMTGSRVSASSGPFLTLSVAAMIQRFTHVML